MLENKKLLLGLTLFLGGILGSGLFAIAQALCDIASKLGNKSQSVCGLLCFLFLVVFVVGVIIIIKELTSKDSK